MKEYVKPAVKVYKVKLASPLLQGSYHSDFDDEYGDQDRFS